MQAPGEAAARFPLQWPAGWPRTPAAQRTRATFRQTKHDHIVDSTGSRQVTKSIDVSAYVATGRLERELERLGATMPVLSTNMQLRLDGRPRSDRDPDDPGAAVYFRLKNRPRCLACDRFSRLGDNIAALAAHIDALRRIDRYGVGTLEQAFAGYQEGLPPVPEHDWHLVLGVRESATVAEIQRAFEALAKRAHPDAGGTHEEMSRLTRAREAALRIRGVA